MDNIMEQEIGLTYGLINEKNNQYIEQEKKNDTIQGNANMLMSGKV